MIKITVTMRFKLPLIKFNIRSQFHKCCYFRHKYNAPIPGGLSAILLDTTGFDAAATYCEFKT